ncbi:MAG: sigma-70 family RNA polymerase sigma factor [Bacteroidota bacterium]
MAGNTSAFESIVVRYESLVAKIIIPMVGNKYDADDIGQETFIRFYKSMKQFKGDSQLGTYLARIAINLSLNEIKKRSRHRISSTDDYPEVKTHMVNNEKSGDITDMVNSALNLLDIRFRSIIVLRHIQGFSTKETANILELPLGTVLSRLSRGQEKLKEIITKLDIR